MKYLITGGSGFLGEALVKKLYKGNQIVVLARNEGKLIELKQQFPKIEIIPGDVSSSFEVNKAMKGVDGAFHLAAFKHVGLAEDNVLQCVGSNVLGSINIINASLIHKPKFVIGISTDKAAQVAGVYGATKLLMERLFNEAQLINPKTKYRIVRYGNVLFSTGSVVPRWIEAVKIGLPIYVTEPEATRFFWTRDEAIKLIFDCINKAKSPEPFVPKMKAIRIIDLLLAIQDKYGEGKLKYKVTGLKAGENMHETIDGKTFSNQVKQFTIKEILTKI